MAIDWAADVRKFAPNAKDETIAAIVKYCGIALRRRDSARVSFTDAKEVARVRNNFLKRKLGLTQPDEELDAGIAATAAKMKGRTKNRVTVYYLLADHFGKLSTFG